VASGYVFDAKAFDMINDLPPEVDLEIVVDKLLLQKAVTQADGKVVTVGDVLRALPPDFSLVDNREQTTVDEPVSLEVTSDPTLAISPAEANEGYNHLFKDRYERLMSIVKGRPDSRGIVGVSAIKEIGEGEKVRVAGLVTGRNNRKNNVEITLDDPSGTARISCQDDQVMRSAMEVPLDGMVVAEVSRGRSGQIYANSIMLPDVPGRRVTSFSHRVYAVLLSDLHIGSRMFLEEDFKRFLHWLNGELGDADIVNRVRYVVIAGDVVDGVGVYPGQELQLVERDPMKQYQMAAELLKQISPKIQIVLSPGNHDAVRQALPQPAVGLDIAGPLYEMDNVKWVGDPCYVKLNGVNMLVYHGKSLDDVIATTPDLSYDRPTDAMKLLLRSRHLAPTYGKRTALSPEMRDFMVVDPVPDILHSGHVHTFGELSYRGTLLINSGTWQSQTSFQSNMGLEPTPSIVPIVDLSTLQAVRRNFGQAGFAGS
jgi:DNA polymerase II small subunit